MLPSIPNLNLNSPLHSQMSSPFPSTSLLPLLPLPLPVLPFKFASLPTSSSFPTPRPPISFHPRSTSSSKHRSSFGSTPRRPLKPSSYPSTRPRLSSEPPILSPINLQIVRVPEIRSPLRPHPSTCPLLSRSLNSLNTQSSKSNLVTLLPVHVIQRIFEFLPDAHGFPSTFRSRSSGYGFDPASPPLSSSCTPSPPSPTPPSPTPPSPLPPLACIPLLAHRHRHRPTSSSEDHWKGSSFQECRLATDESEGVWWPNPPFEMRLVCRRWAAVGAHVFFRHLSIHTSRRLASLNDLFASHPLLAPCVRTLLLATPTPPAQLHKLLLRLPQLRALALRGPPPAPVPAPPLPQTLVRLAVELARPIGNGKAHLAEFAGVLANCPDGLETLRVKGFESQRPRKLATCVARLEAVESRTTAGLTSLVLVDCVLSEEDARFLGHRFPGLRSIKVENTVVRPEAIGGINRLIEDPQGSLERLDVRVAGMIEHVGTTGGSLKLNPLVVDGLPNLTRLSLEVPCRVEIGKLGKLREANVDGKLVGEIWKASGIGQVKQIYVVGWRWGEVGCAGAMERWEVQRECWRRGVGWGERNGVGDE